MKYEWKHFFRPTTSVLIKNWTTTASLLTGVFKANRKILQVEVKDQEAGDMGVNNPNDMAFLYFPNNFTKDLTTYIINREYNENLAYARIARESKNNNNLSNIHKFIF